MGRGSQTHSSHGGASTVLSDSEDDKKHVIELMKTDYTYPKPGDPEFQRKIYEKREFNFHKIPSREHIKTYEDVKNYRDKHCARDFALYSHQNFLANMFNPETDYKGLLVMHGLGSGKCVSSAEAIYINGLKIKIGDLFDLFARKDSKLLDQDGGEWYEPTITLTTNSINETTGKIIQTQVKKIYRQKISEDIVTVRLENGLKMTMTQAHRLLTTRGWQNSLEYHKGTFVALPKFLIPDADTNLPVPDWGIQQSTEPKVFDETKDLEYVKIDKIERAHHDGWVYDLEIDTHHNYVAEGMMCHNTCSAIAIAEQFKAMVQKYGTKIHILVPGPVIKEVWKEHLIKCSGETYMKYQDRTSIADEAEFARQKKMALNTAMQYYRFMSYRSFSKRVMGERIIDRRVGDSKAKSKYRKSDGEYERDMPVDRIHNLNNTLIIVDEAHNLTGNDYGAALMEIAKKSQNCRIVLLTATPMKNLADDIVELINFIRPHDKPIEREKVFTAQSGHQMELREGGLEYLKKMCRGYISYMRGADPITFAKRVDIGEVPPGLKFTKVVSCQMYPFQRVCYDEAVRDEGDALSKKSEAVANFVVPGLSPDKKTVVGYYGREGIQLVCNQLKTHAPILNQRIAENMPGWLRALPECAKMTSAQIKELVEGGQGRDEWIKLAENGKTIAGRILSMPFLRLFSTKFADALDGMAERVEGKRGAMTSFSYSNLVKAGIELFQEVLQQNGYLEFDEGGNYQIGSKTICHRCGKKFEGHDSAHIFRPATFITVTGKSSDEVAEYIPEDKQRVIRSVFNSLDNLDGRNIKFILGSRVMNEGVSLENLGEIDILDVYFNFGRVDQVVGRGIRNCSHYKTVTDTNRYPEVKVYKFAITLGEGSREEDNYKLSSEEELYQKAELKYLLIKQVERTLKEIAVDCALNRNGNIFAEEVEKHKGCAARGDCPAICDYTECDYKCDDPELNNKWLGDDGNYINVPKKDLDYTTFGSRLARDEINFAKERIKDMFRLTPQYKLKNIVAYVKLGYTEQQHIELFDDMFVYRALDELLPKTENDFNNFRDTLVDGFGNMGYLIHRGEYYIFQPMNQTEDVPMYYRTNFNQTMVNKLSIFNYMRHTIDWDTVEKETAETAVEEDEESSKEGNKGGYDFESVRDYYDNRDEFEIVGILDQDVGRRKTAENAADIFKIRQKRSKILDKRRGTGISSYKGSVCGTSKSREYLEEVAKKIGAKIKLGDPTTSRSDLCNAIQERLIEFEKYGTDNITYIILPANHKKYTFPLNLKDRTKQTVDTIKGTMKGSAVSIEKDKAGADKLVRKYTIRVKPHGTGSEKILKEMNASKEADGSWILVIE
jgi:DNA polymerase III delta prime subunit